MSRPFDAERYLDRLRYSRPREVSALSLAALQERHLLTVPFENLDIHLGRPLSLDEDELFDKVVTRRRGGFCYELNGLFARLLRELGYEVTLLSCRVYDREGALGPHHDHLALLVHLDRRWLVDVGFGDSSPRPLDIDSAEPQPGRGKAYRVVTGDRGRLIYAERNPDGAWSDQYSFTLAPRTLDTFREMCLWHQQSPDSHFTQKRICTRLTDEGRMTLSEGRLIHTVAGQRQESPIAGEDAFRAALSQHFGIVLDRSPARG